MYICGVTLDRTLTYKDHIHKLKWKTSARNNILRKLSNTKWGAKPVTIKTTAFALCYSMAEYVCFVWEGSTHVSKLYPALNEALNKHLESRNSFVRTLSYHLKKKNSSRTIENMDPPPEVCTKETQIHTT